MTEQRPRLLVVDSEAAHLRDLCDSLKAEGYVTRGFVSAKEALSALRPGEHDLLLTDLMMPDMNGIELSAAARDIDPDLEVIVMTRDGTSGTIDTAVKAMNRLQRENAQLHRRERQRREELAAANAALESFSYSVSHDLRAPLRSIDSLVQILAEDHGEQLGEDARSILNVIKDGCGRMDQLITGLLAYSQCTRQALDRMSLDMTALARAALSEVLTEYSGPQPTVEIAPLPPAAGDVMLIRQVWRQLLGNALKFSARKSSPRVLITGRIEAGETRYRIEDNGSGFDMKQSHRLFGVFQRLHKAGDYSGTGVGLAIVQRIIARHSGQICAQAAPDVGAIFEFSLPGIAITD